MLNIVLGSSPEEKLQMYAAEIKLHIDAGESVLAIVPDQFSFEFDKSLYNILGAKDFNCVKVISFKKLSEELILGCESRVGTLMKSEEKIAVIYLAIKNVRAEKKLKALSHSLDKPAFISELSGIFDSIQRSGLSPEMLEEAAERIPGTAGEKLCDIARIYSEYLSELSKRGLRDESSTVSFGARLADATEYFKNKHIYIDRFDSYSADELSIINLCIRDAKSVSISLTLPYDLKPTPTSPYSVCFETQNRLVSLAAVNNKRVKYINCPSKTVKPNGLRGVEVSLLGGMDALNRDDGSVRILSCSSVYEEADFAAAKIREYVSRGLCTYNDIGVITHDIQRYQSALESSFERYDIPYFLDSKQKASDMSFTLYVLAVLDAAASRRLDTERIMKFVRSAFSEFDDTEISLIEDYCVRWNVVGDMWLEEFSVGGTREELEALNDIRQRIILPLEKLRQSAKNASARDIAVAVNEYIKECGLAQRSKQIIDDCAQDSLRLESARLFKQLWNCLMNCVAAIFNTVGEEKLTVKEFAELLKLMLSNSGVSSPPQRLSSVVVYDIGRSVISAPKIAFVLGANDGLFPCDRKKTGIFSGKDHELFNSEGVGFEASDLQRMETERFDCFRALTCADEKLYILYSLSDVSGKTQRPSHIVTKLSKYLGIAPVKADSFPIAFYASAPKAAYYRLLISNNRPADELASLRLALEQLPEYKAKLEAVSAAAKGRAHSLSGSVAKRLFAPADINVTASRIDVYNKCAFKYFVKYGLGIEKIAPLSIDPANRGSIMHFVFQCVLEYFGESFDTVDADRLDTAVSQLLEKYEAEFLGGTFGKSAKFKADYARLKDACIEILLNIQSEYRVSKFRPVRFEYNLSKQNGESILSIPINSELNINIRGIIDRVDVCCDECGRQLIRIVDYKTGSKELKFEDIYNGLNLQMLLYMTALTDGAGSDFKSFVPAGVLYMKAGFLECADDYSPISEEAQERFKKSAAQLKRSGLVVDDSFAVDAMDCEVSGLYAPVTRKKDGSYTARSSVISSKEFKRLQEFSINKVKEFGMGLILGRIEANPCGRDNEHLECAYCDYASVCARQKYIYRQLGKDDANKLAELLKEEV